MAAGQEQLEKWDAGGADLPALHRALVRVDGFEASTLADLQPMRTKGLVHAHVRIRGAGAVLRIPRLSSYGFQPADNLSYQAACFSRAGDSGHVPRLLAEIAPAPGIPWGALVISEVAGRTPDIPLEMSAIAAALAAMHALPVPPLAERSPLLSHDNPVSATMTVIERQAEFLPGAGIDPRSQEQLDEELAWARGFSAEVAQADIPVTLAGTDTHPGNFMIREDGRAIFVDLEKTLYGAPAIDLAHASVYTSTMWDDDVGVALTEADVTAFYEDYFARIPASLAERLRPWCRPLRRLTWLRTTTWAAKWKVESRNGEAWSAARHDPAYLERVRLRVADYFDPDTIDRIRSGLVQD